MPPPVVLTIAGSDSSCGAGAQADLKTFGALGCHGLTVITCIVAEKPGEVRAIQAASPAIVRDQLEILLESYPVAAIKTGMLFSPAIIRTIGEILSGLAKCPPLVIDPVMVSSSGDPLLKGASGSGSKQGVLNAYKKYLFPSAMLITPNLDELDVLVGLDSHSFVGMSSAGKLLTALTGASILLKGGHLRGRIATDILLSPDWKDYSFSAPFIRGLATHGTGCTYSAAIAAYLARGMELPKAVAEAKKFVTRAIREAAKWGRIAALNQIQG